MDTLSYNMIIALLITLRLSGADALESDIIGITVAACVSFFFLCVVITMIVVSFSWKNWYNSWMRGKGRVRMPKEYFRKKEEARRRLLAESASHSIRSAHSGARSHPPSVSNLNGQPPYQTVDRALYEKPDMVLKYPSMSEKTSWVQGWNQNSGPREQETLDATMVLGDEQDEEFKIETVLVDNEVLDVGPYKDNHPGDKPVQGDVYPVPYIYSAGDKGSSGANGVTSAHVTSASSSTTAGTVPAALASSTPRGATLSGEMVEMADNSAYSTVGDVQTLDDMVVHL